MPVRKLPDGTTALTTYYSPLDPAYYAHLQDLKDNPSGNGLPLNEKIWQIQGKPKATTAAPASTASSSSGGSSRMVLPTASSSGSSSSSKQTTPAAEKPELNLPSLEMSEWGSVLNQFNKLRSKDSVLKQQAVADAHSLGVAGGKIHSSQQAGAVERTIEDRLMPLAQAEASLVASTDINNWQNNVNQYMTVYQSEFTDYLKDKGYDHEKAVARMHAETAITTALMDNIGRLLNNTDLELGAESYQKLIDPYNAMFTSDWFNYA